MNDPIIKTTRLTEDLLLLAPGSNMDRDHPHLSRLAKLCEDQGFSTWRFQFRYRDEGRPFPPKDISITINEYESHLRQAALTFPHARLHLGGHSYGARIATHVAAKLIASDHQLARRLCSIIVFSLPIHPAKKPHLERWDHTKHLSIPVCLISGDRDLLAEPAQLAAFMTQLPSAIKSLTLLSGTDHGFKRLAAYRQQEDPYAATAKAVNQFLASVAQGAPTTR